MALLRINNSNSYPVVVKRDVEFEAVTTFIIIIIIMFEQYFPLAI